MGDPFGQKKKFESYKLTFLQYSSSTGCEVKLKMQKTTYEKKRQKMNFKYTILQTKGSKLLSRSGEQEATKMNFKSRSYKLKGSEIV